MNGLSRIHKTRIPSTNGKWTFKGILILVVVLLVFGLLVWAMLGIATTPKTPTSSEKIWSIITEQGYEPEDVTAYYCVKDPAFQDTLTKCIAFEKDDIHFEFFDFNNEHSAINIYKQAYEMIEKNEYFRRKSGTHIANHSIYTLDSEGKYSVAIRVGHTALYAYCDSENKNEINKILNAIDYLEP